MKFINFLFYFIFLIGFNALAMEHEVSNNTHPSFVQDLQILALEKAQQLDPHTQEQQLESLLQKYPHADIYFYRFLMQKPNEEMIASEIHIRSFLAYFLKNNDYFDSKKIPFEKAFEIFFDIYAPDGLEVPNNLFKNKQAIKNITKKILDEEQKHNNWFVFYHAMHQHKAFVMDILTELRTQLTDTSLNYGIIWESPSDAPQTLQQHIDQKTKLATKNMQNQFNNTTTFLLNDDEANTLIRQFLAGENILHLDEARRFKIFNNLREALRYGLYPHYMLSTNFALFGNNGYSLEYSFRFFIENISYRYTYQNNQYQEPPLEKLKTILTPLISIFEKLKVDQGYLSNIVNDFFQLYKKYFPSQTETGGRLLTIFVHPSIVEKVACMGIHIPAPINYNNKKLSNPAQYLPLFRKNPALCELLLRRSHTRYGEPQNIPTSIYSDKKAQIKSKKNYIKRGTNLNGTLSYPELEINRLFSCFFIDPHYVYNPENIKIQHHDLFFNSEQKDAYNADLQKLVTHYLSLAKNSQLIEG